MQKATSKLKRYKREIIYSALITLFLLVAGYFANNLPLFTGENLNAYAWMESLNNIIGQEEEEDCDDVRYVNTAFDKELITAFKQYEEDGPLDTLGNTEITSRKDLYLFLNLIKDVDYKYLILDIQLSKDLHSNELIFDEKTGDSVNVDVMLCDLLKKMKRVVIAKPLEEQLIDNDLNALSAKAYYKTTVTGGNFVRYEYFDSIPFIPLSVYNNIQREQHQPEIVCHYPFGAKWLKRLAWYTQGGKLCYNTLFLDFRILDDGGRNWGEMPGMNANLSDFQYQDIGRDIVDRPLEEQQSLIRDYQDKYVVVGNMVEDLHDTYAGPQQGPVILYKAIKALEDGKHIVSFTSILLLSLLYFFITLFILTKKSVFNWVPFIAKSNHGLLHFIVDVFTFSSVLFIFHFVEYMTHRVSYSFIVPVIVFTALKTYIIIKKDYHMRKTIPALLIALLAGLLMSFKNADQKDGKFRVTYCSSSKIQINNKPIDKKQMIGLNDTINFSNADRNQFLRIEALKDMVITNKKGKKETWYANTSKKLSPINNKRKFDFGWWIRNHGTIYKSASTFAEDDIYLTDDSVAVQIEERLVDFDRQYYTLTILDGMDKNKSVKLSNDDEKPLVWIFKEDLTENGIDCSKERTFMCRVDFYNHGTVSKTFYTTLTIVP